MHTYICTYLCCTYVPVLTPGPGYGKSALLRTICTKQNPDSISGSIPESDPPLHFLRHIHRPATKFLSSSGHWHRNSRSMRYSSPRRSVAWCFCQSSRYAHEAVVAGGWVCGAIRNRRVKDRKPGIKIWNLLVDGDSAWGMSRVVCLGHVLLRYKRLALDFDQWFIHRSMQT